MAGVTLGLGIAGVGAGVVPRARPPDLPVGGRRVDIGPRPTGAGVRIVVNPAAGAGRGALVVDQLARALPGAGVRTLRTGEDLTEVLTAAARDAEVLGIVGGDGSANTAAGVAAEVGLPLLVVPGGTLNHFARDLGLDGPADAVAAVRAGTAVQVDVGEVDDRLFLNTASLGSYPEFVAVRETWEHRVGKPLAALVATHRVLRGARPLELVADGRRLAVAALFVGAGRYAPPGVVPARRERMDSGVLDVRLLAVGDRRARLHALAGLVTRRAQVSSPFLRLETPLFTVQVPGESLLARDGEVGPVAGAEVTCGMRPAALTVLRPWADEAAASGRRRRFDRNQPPALTTTA